MEECMAQLIIAIDGLAGTGKGIIAEAVANHFNIQHLDTGIYYRIITYLIIKEHILVSDIKAIKHLLKNFKVTISKEAILVNGEDVTKRIRDKDIDDLVSIIACYKDLKKAINKKIRQMIKVGDWVIDGRDTTTLIAPKTPYKIYLDASFPVRVQRRLKQYTLRHISTSYEEVESSIKTRDLHDQTKEYGALKQAPDALYIDTTNLEIKAIVNMIINYVKGD